MSDYDIIVVYTNLGVLLECNGTTVLIYYNVFVEAEPLPTPIIVVYTNLGVLLVSNGTSVLIYYNVFV